MILMMLGLQLVGTELLRYQTDLFQTMEIWRLLTGHWVHANWPHFLLNMSGFLLCVALTEVKWSFWQWGWRVLVLTTGISVGFLLLNPEIHWYVGFSGVLFGLYVLAAVATFNHHVLISRLILVFIGIKIILEQWSSVKISSADLIGVPVLEDAHFYGVILAIFIIIIQDLTNRILGEF